MSSRRTEVRGLAVYGHLATADQAGAERLVLVHGTLDRAAGMLRVARQLGEFEITRYDRRGYARSAPAGAAQSFEQQLEDLAAVMRAGPTNTGPSTSEQPAIVMGHSYGGVLALSLAARGDPLIGAVVSFEAPRAWESWWTPPPADDINAQAAAEQFLRSMIGDEVWESLPSRTRNQRRDEGEVMIAELRHQAQRRYDAAKISVPVVIGVGELSGPRSQRAAKLTAQEAPNAELVSLTAAGHGAPTSHPAEVAQLVRLAQRMAS